MACCRDRSRTSGSLARDSVRVWDRWLFQHRPGAGALGRGDPLRICNRRVGVATPSAARVSPCPWTRRRYRGFRHGHAQARRHRARGPLAAGLELEIAGFVEMREARERSDRITVSLSAWPVPAGGKTRSHPGVAAQGHRTRGRNFVEFKARFSPPLEPLRPGGYDFARDMYFQRIGASGFVLGRIRIAPSPRPPAL